MTSTTTPAAHPFAGAPFLDPALPVAARVADLVGRMTLAEKVGQMMQLPAGGYQGDDDPDLVRRLVVDHHVGSILHASPESLAKAHDLVATTRLRIPLLIGEDCIHGHSFFRGATIYPTQL
ncbi:glycoside hydrolase family 3 N-terminal domain-containing protein, partial [Cutibacterium acnes]